MIVRVLHGDRHGILNLIKSCRHQKVRLFSTKPYSLHGTSNATSMCFRGIFRFGFMMLGSALGKESVRDLHQEEYGDSVESEDLPKFSHAFPSSYFIDFPLIECTELLLPGLRNTFEFQHDCSRKTTEFHFRPAWDITKLYSEQASLIINKCRSKVENILNVGLKFPITLNAEGYPGPSVSTHEDASHELTIEEKIISLKSELLEEQLHYQQKIFKLEKENQELRRQIMLRQDGRDLKLRKLKRNPVEAYSEIVEDLTDLQRTFGRQIMLPQVVVVGDVGSGKSCLLEMLMHTRILPRRDFSLQIPLKLTLCEGPYHLAQFNDTDREFDLENMNDVNELRKELELRLKSAAAQETYYQPVSLTVWGPGLSRMVITDLPSLPNDGNSKLAAASIPEWSREMSLSLLQSPQTLILCLIDGSNESNYSKTVELVKDFDPDGRRTVYVLTKADLAETSLANPEKARRIADGSIFPLKAVGYYSVIPGRGPIDEPLSDVEKFEEIYFASSKIFQSGMFKPENLTTKELSRGIAHNFWKFVKSSLRPQIDVLKARKSALEKEWKSRYQKARVLDRDELYENGRMQLLDDVVRLSSMQATSCLKISGEMRLKNWAESLLPMKSIEVAAAALHRRFSAVAGRARESEDDIYNNFKQTVVNETFKLHKLDSKARENLRSTLVNVCEAPYIITPDDWSTSVRFMEQACADRLSKIQNEFKTLLGPSTFEKWFLFRNQTTIHRNRRAVVDVLEKLIAPPGDDMSHGAELSKDETNMVIKTLESQSIKVDHTFVRETWRYIFLSRFLEQAINRITLCGDISECDDFNSQQLPRGACADVDLFHRVKILLRTASITLRHQIMTTEIVKLEGEVKQILDSLERDPTKIKQYFNHPRIELAEELKKITLIQEKLEDLAKLIEEDDAEPAYGRNNSSGDDGP